jgi:pyruvate/oxaloacetate carboxyltransferase
MDEYKEYISLGFSELDTLGQLDYMPYVAVDVTRVCFSELDYDPWELLRAIRSEMTHTPLALTLAGQCLVTDRILPDDVVDAFITRAVENGISEFRIYDPLNDPRNLQTAIAAAKRCGAKVSAGMVYAKNPAYSQAFFAAYAAQLSALGADGIWLFSMSDEFSCRETVTAIKESISVPLGVSCTSPTVSDIAIDADADFYENEVCDFIPAELSDEIECLRESAGYPPLYGFIRDIITEQAANGEASTRFKSLLLGKYGRTPCPISQELISGMCGGEALVLVRPADLLAPVLDEIEEKIAPWSEQDEDSLTYALFGDEAIEFFKRRNAKRYSLDLPHAHAERGIHTV